MSTAKKIDLLKAIAQAYIAEVEPQTITIYGSDVAYCTWDLLNAEETSRSVVFVYNGTSWYKVGNGNKTLCGLAYYQLGCHGWDYETFNRKTGLCLDMVYRKTVEAEVAKVRSAASKRASIVEGLWNVATGK